MNIIVHFLLRSKSIVRIFVKMTTESFWKEISVEYLIRKWPLRLWNSCLFVCLFFWHFSSHSRIFHSYGDINMTGEGLQILTYAQHLLLLISEGSLTCHTYCDTGNPFIIVISENPWHSHLLQWRCHYLFLRLTSVTVGIRTPNLPLAGRTL